MQALLFQNYLGMPINSLICLGHVSVLNGMKMSISLGRLLLPLSPYLFVAFHNFYNFRSSLCNKLNVSPYLFVAFYNFYNSRSFLYNKLNA